MREQEIRKRDIFNQYLELARRDIEKHFNTTSFISVPCPACGSTNYQSEFEKSGFSYVSCHHCGTLFVNPRPTPEMLDYFYARSESTSFWVNEFFKPVEAARREKIFKPRVEYFIEHFPEIENGLIGDIGAGFGIFLLELATVWTKARLVAIEPSLEMAEICREKGLEVIPETIEEVTGHENSFDAITLFELFEHLHHPESVLLRIHKLLKPNGILLITTLNGHGFDILELWEKSKSISPPHHLNFFNPHSMTLILERCGFQVEKKETPGKLDWDILEGMYRNENVGIGRFWRHVADADESVKQKLQEWITNSGLSSHMRIIGRKK